MKDRLREPTGHYCWHEAKRKYLYSPDGQRVKKVAAGVSTYYINQYFEVENTTQVRYYYFGGQRIAMRRAGVLTYLHADHPSASLRGHLGSPVLIMASAASSATQTYQAGACPEPGRRGIVRNFTGSFPTDHQFTGQQQDGNGLIYYN